jgi:hypothetical protein
MALLGVKRLPLILVIITAITAIAEDASSPVVVLIVDETHAARRIAFVHEEIRVQPGPVALAQENQLSPR